MAKRWRASAIRALTSFGAVPPKLVRAAAELTADKRPINIRFDLRFDFLQVLKTHFFKS